MKETLCKVCKKNKELIFYCMIGCTGATLDFIIYTVLTGSFGFHYQVANYLSVSVGIINNFILNRSLNFKTKDRTFVRLCCFYSVGMLGWALSAGCLWLFIEVLGLNAIMAKLITIFFVTVTQFGLNKCITFKKGIKHE